MKISTIVRELIRLFSDLTDDIEAMANEAVTQYPDLAQAKAQFVDAYIEKWRDNLTPERARARAEAIWVELHAEEKGFDSEAGSSA